MGDVSASPLLRLDTLPKRIETYYPTVEVILFPNIGIFDDICRAYSKTD